MISPKSNGGNLRKIHFPEGIRSRCSWIKNSAFILITLLLIFILSNLLALGLIYWRSPAIALYEPDAYRGIRLKANLNLGLPIGTAYSNPKSYHGAQYRVATDARGLRIAPSHPIPSDPAQKTFTIICFGDSHTFGWDVDAEWTYPAQLAELLRTQLRIPDVQVINAGVPAYTSRQALAYLSRELLDLHPAVVSFAFGIHEGVPSSGRNWCPISDLRDADLIKGDSLERWNPITLSLSQRLRSDALRLPFLTVFRFIHSRIKPFEFDRFVTLAQSQPRDRSYNYEGTRVPPHNFESDLLDLFELGRRHSFLPIVLVTYNTIFKYQQMAESVCRQLGVPFINMDERFKSFQPQELQQRPELAELGRKYWQWLGPSALAENPMFLLTTDGGHPNPLGDRLIAEAMLQALRQRGIGAAP
jgi:lysophospholipase L1-like esterase